MPALKFFELSLLLVDQFHEGVVLTFVFLQLADYFRARVDVDALDELQVFLTQERIFTGQFLELILEGELTLHED